MNILRSVFLPAALAAAVIAPSAAFAQQAAAPAVPASANCSQEQSEHHMGGGHRNPFESLNLTEQQKAQIKQIRQQFRAQHPCDSATPEQRQQLRQQVLNVLTPQQRAQLQAERQGGKPPSTP